MKTPMTLQLAEQAEQILFFLCLYRAGLNQSAAREYVLYRIACTQTRTRTKTSRQNEGFVL